jgi:phosphoribosyl 1,2-cyclic phosphodiesterase/ActR/RegA family two-component response regulator
MIRIRFWGTRGSLATPGPTTLRYGGNTSCVEVRTADGTLIVLDCGTGAHRLGQALLASAAQPVGGHLLITHTHWDHIQGFPFFAPLFIPGSQWDLYAPGGRGHHLEATLAGQMEYTYFPVTLEQLGAAIRFHDLIEGQLSISRTHIVTHYMNHPALTLGYRLEADGVVIVYAVDHEPHGRAQPGRGNLDTPTPGSPAVHREDQRHIEFLAGADLVIHDAQYTVDEYPKKIGWGHTPAEWAVDYALAAGAKRLALFHHDPLRDDDALDRLVEICRRRVVSAGGLLDVFAAAEGHVLELKGQGSSVSPRKRSVKAEVTDDVPAIAATVLIADADPTIVQLLVESLQTDGLKLLTAADGETALRMAKSERPVLMLLDSHMPGLVGADVVRNLRADSDPYFRTVPIVLMTGKAGPENTAAGFAAGVTDYLLKPFAPALVRARVRAWLLRGDARSKSGV